MSITLALAALAPFVPLITKAWDAKADEKTAKQVIKDTSGLTEVIQGSYGTALWLVYQDAQSCGAYGLDSLSCVTLEHWGFLGSALAIAATAAIKKYKAKDNG